jgi:hypothetical protein
VEFTLKYKARRRRDMAMIQAAGAGREFDDHIHRARPYVNIEQFVVTASGNEIFPVHVASIKTEIAQGIVAL